MLLHQNFSVLRKKTAAVSLIFILLLLFVFQISGGRSTVDHSNSGISKNMVGYAADFKNACYTFSAEEIIPKDDTLLLLQFAIAGFSSPGALSALFSGVKNTASKITILPFRAEVRFYQLYCNWKFDFPG